MKFGPTANKSRIQSLDLIRGIAVFGIILMNISSFSMIGVAYMNPTVMGGLEDSNGVVHSFNYLFANEKFMSLFSILFGAGILLFCHRIEEKGLSVRKYYFKRIFFLFVFGMIHAYLIWMGDILVAYSICGFLAYFLRKKSIKTLLIIASIIFLVPVILNMSWFYLAPHSSIANELNFWNPTQVEMSEELALLRGSFWDVQTIRTKGAFELQTFIFLIHTFWRAFSLMLLGMALYKSGVLQGERSKKYYLKMLFIMLPIGLIFSYTGLSQAYAHGWDAAHGFVFSGFMNYIGALFTALAYLGLFVLWSKTNFALTIQEMFKSSGRMAFTIYILTSVICTFLFYGYGFGLVGSFDRVDQLITVCVITVVLLIVSYFYLKNFKQGPLEKLWRKLTYM